MSPETALAGLGPLAELQAIGRGPAGTTRLAWTPELAAAERWFGAQAAACGLVVERDAAGSLWAVPKDVPPPWWGVGSHLDSVRDGGAFDGALGVAAAFAVAAATDRPLAVIAFADEEGGRFNTPTFGSRALAGRLDVPDAVARTDADGIALGRAMADFGVDPAGLAGAPAGLARLRGFVELHIDQGTAVADAGAPIGVVARIAARRRLRAELHGVADHAGTAPPATRADALAAAAALIVAAGAAGPPGDGSMRRTATRIVVAPNAATTIAAKAVVWLDGRAATTGSVDAWADDVDRIAADVAARHRVRAVVHREAASPAIAFDPGVVAALGAAAPDGAPAITCFAGHDAAILAPRVPAGMVLVRNPTGISHAAEEHVTLEDAAVGVATMIRALEELA